MKKDKPTPRSAKRWEVKVNGKWMPAVWNHGRPRVGGLEATPYRYFGKIQDVRPA